MKIFLSNNEPENKSYIWINNIATLDDKVLDSEATSIICDNFLSIFPIDQLTALIAKIISKMRLNCELTIKDVDSDIINRRFINEEIDINEVNTIMFGKNQKRRSILNIVSVSDVMPKNIKIQNKDYHYNSCSFIIKYKRVS